MSEYFISKDLRNCIPFKKIDVVLQFVIDANDPPYRKFDEIQKEIVLNIESKELIEIIDKLLRDGLVKKDFDIDNCCVYFSTFDGRVFLLETGGYMKKQEFEYLKNNRFEHYEKRRKSYENKLIFGTWTAGIACILLFAIEFIKCFLVKH